MPHNRTPVPDRAAGDVLILFTRLPTPGEVKTRLAKQLGPALAAEHYRAYVEWILDRTASPAPGTWRRWVAFTPAIALKAFRTWLAGQPIDHFLPQAPGDLGVRLMAATGAAFHARASRTVVIGTDCLEVNQGLIARAFEALDEHEAVVGPTHSGGYYLLGLRQLCPKIFQQIPWGTDQVLAATRMRAQELKLSLFELPKHHDIDAPADLVHLPAQFLEAHPELASAAVRS